VDFDRIKANKFKRFIRFSVCMLDALHYNFAAEMMLFSIVAHGLYLLQEYGKHTGDQTAYIATQGIHNLIINIRYSLDLYTEPMCSFYGHLTYMTRELLEKPLCSFVVNIFY